MCGMKVIRTTAIVLAAGQGKSMRWQAEGNQNNGSIMAEGVNKGEEKGWLWQIKRRVSILG